VLLLPAAGQAAGLLVADGGFGGVLEIKEHAVEMTVNNGIVVTRVTQVFVNTENRQVEALYTFLVPTAASVANFSMWIDGKEMVGEVVEKQRAREIYNSYKQRRRDPGLLEQTDYKTFEMRIFPIAPRAEQRVQITYYQELELDADWATVVYPLATLTRSDLSSRTTGRFALTLDATSEVPIVSLTSPSHPDGFVVVRHNQSYVQASLETDGGDLSRDLVLAFNISRPHTGIDLLATRQPGEDGYFQLTVTAGEELAKQALAMDYLFILDVSGSMAHDGKMGISRRSIGAFVDEIGDQDRFEVMSFNIAPQSLFNRLRDADEPTRQEAKDFLASRQARGGTELQPALELAFSYKDPDHPLNVVILSDGMTATGERQVLLHMSEVAPPGTRVFCIGVGNEVDRPLLSQLAEETGGLAAFVSRGDDLERRAKAFRNKLLRPVASNLELDFSGIEVYDTEPRRLPDLFYGSPVRLYGRYRTSGEAVVRLRADVGGETIEQRVNLTFPEQEESNTELERMWAWHRVQSLLRQADRSGSRSSAQAEIVRLGEAYSIVTEYTSFLVLENDAEYRRWKIDRRNALRIKRDRRQQQRVNEQLTQLRRDSAAALGPLPEDTPKLAAAAVPVPATSPATTAAPRPAAPPRARPRSRDLDLFGGGGGGGGAIDPMMATLALLAAGLGLLALRSKS